MNLDKNKARSRLSFTQWMLLGLALGIALGVFLGELAAPLAWVGKVYVGLLQMTVLPYMLFSIISNIGRLSSAQSLLIARVGVVVLLGLWIAYALVVWCMALALPYFPSGAFFSTSLVAPPAVFDYMGLFVPSNLFRALSDNAVPAVVLFSLLFGVGLMGVDRKNLLLAPLDLVVEVLQRINKLLIKITPIGIFAIAASASGTLSFEQFYQLQAYVVLMGVATLLVVLVVLPLVVSTVTGLSWWRVVEGYRDGVLTAFVLGSTFAAIPLLLDASKRLIAECQDLPGSHNDDGEHHAELMLPLAYPFADAGKFLSLVFVVFAGWFYGAPLEGSSLLLTLMLGPILLFGKVLTAIPFLLDLHQIPQDIFQLFLASGVVLGRIADAAGAAHLVAFTVVSAVLVQRGHALNTRRVVQNGMLAAVLLAGVTLVIGGVLGKWYPQSSATANPVLTMQVAPHDVPMKVLHEPSTNPVARNPEEGHSERILRRGVLRVGYSVDRLPFSFFNQAGELVGFDIDLITQLATDLKVALEFVPYSRDTLLMQMSADHFDIALSGITATVNTDRMGYYSEPYLHVNMGLVVADHRKRALDSEEEIRANADVRLGVLQGSYFVARARDHFPEAELVYLQSERDFFEGKTGQMDGLVTTAEGGAAWTLLYPDYVAVNPVGGIEQAPLVFAIPADMDMEEYLEVWIQLRTLDGTVARLFDYWIEGKTERNPQPRWSVIRNVLGWVE